MTKSKKELIRVQNLIECDRLSGGENFEELIVYDLHKILIDYFDYRGMPSLKILKSGGKINVEIFVQAQSVKPFNIVPK